MWCRFKEDIFRSVALGTVEPVLTFIEQERSRSQSVAAALYRLIWFDTYHLCTNENVLGSPTQFHEMTRDRFPEFWDSRDRIIDAYRKLISKGVRDKIFRVRDLKITANLIFGLGESTIIWYLPEAKKPAAAKVADNAASLALNALLRDHKALEKIEAEAGTPLE